MEGKGEKLIDAIAYKLMVDPKFAKKVAEGLLGKVATKDDIEKLERGSRSWPQRRKLTC